MSHSPKSTGGPTIGREVALVGALTALGFLIRLWGLGRLGLVHFDEGIYAIAGLWPLSPRGLDPTLIAYAPPGFPFLVGLAYLVLGLGDASAILVSIVAGTLTIPAAAWLARRTFGPAAGPAAAAVAAVSGFHVAFSRMALTDASFLLCWVVGLIVAGRFLERPGAGRGIALGLAVGVAQLFKYSGWTLGAAVILALPAVALGDASRRTRAYQARAWGFGLLGAAVALAVYAPWIGFVEDHGGYRALLAHHGGYVGSAGSWWPHWRAQLQQQSALSGGFPWNLAGWLIGVGAAIAMRLGGGRRPGLGRLGMLALVVGTGIVAPGLLWWLGLVFWTRGAGPGRRLLGVAWLGLSILTPFYHPYARLWLPIQALGWIAAAGVMAELLGPDARRERTSVGAGEAPAEPAPGVGLGGSLALPVQTLGAIRVFVVPAALVQGLVLMRTPSLAERGAGLLAPSDSLRRAVAAALAELPEGVDGLRILARPPVTFYVGGTAGARVEPDLEGLLGDGSGRWALLDWAMLRQAADADAAEARLLERWERVGAWPTTLNLPTLLDIDPGAAVRMARPTAADAPLWLLRRRGIGEPPR